MMPDGDFFAPSGQSLSGAPTIKKAAALTDALRSGLIEFAEFRECRTTASGEAVVFEVEVERGQIRKNDVRLKELVSVEFFPKDDQFPEVLVLRKNFPSVPHLNQRREEFPRSLCLYDRPYTEVRRSWTPSNFIERVRWWLASTARGDLHGEDQPLEPILAGYSGHIILPTQFFISSDEFQEIAALWIERKTDRPDFLLYHASFQKEGSHGNRQLHAAVLFMGQPTTHGVIRRAPGDLSVLHELGKQVGLAIVTGLRLRLEETLKSLGGESVAFLLAPLIVVLRLPKSRQEQGKVESIEHAVFVTKESTGEVGQKLGVWDFNSGQVGLLLKSENVEEVAVNNAASIALEPLNPVRPFTSLSASIMNGYAPESVEAVTAIGSGALGSQIISNLTRSGFGKNWTIIDDDNLLPHNLARHSLGPCSVGKPKAESLAEFINTLLPEESPATAVVANFLSPDVDERKAIECALQKSNLILDFSASVEVGKNLAEMETGNARKTSVFLSPSGTDLVILDQGADRMIALDELEMYYLGEIATNGSLSGHFSPREGGIRYGNSCRDVSATIPQDRVALHAAIASKSLREAQKNREPAVAIWRINNDCSVSRFDAKVRLPRRMKSGDWTLIVNPGTCERISAWRSEKLPAETGGVLIGAFDLERSVVYVVDVLPSPSDSREWPTAYIRGSRGLKAKVDQFSQRTEGFLHYIGEWHSHPEQSSTRPSGDDKKLFQWLSKRMEKDGFPALMIIAGDDHLSVFIESIQDAENPLPCTENERY